MRFREFANAEDQLGLWKLISQNTWAAIAQSQQQQKIAQAARQRTAKFKAAANKAKLVPKKTPPATVPVGQDHLSKSPYLLNPSKNTGI